MSIGNTGQGFNFVPAYQSSALPWVSGSIVVHTTPVKLTFEKVTKYVKIRARDELRVGFTSNGVTNSNYYTVSSGSVETFDVRTSELYLYAPTSTTVDVFAGLTLIDKRDGVPFLTGSTTFTNSPGSGWQGVG